MRYGDSYREGQYNSNSSTKRVWHEDGHRKGQYRSINENILSGNLIHQGRRKAPSPLPSPPDPYETSTCCPTAFIIARQGWDPSVGVGGAWEGRWGPRADPGSPSTLCCAVAPLAGACPTHWHVGAIRIPCHAHVGHVAAFLGSTIHVH
jgi:hypothetical protein